MKNPAAVAVLLAAALAACGSPPPDSAEKAPEGRAETQGIRNTENIGVSGEAIADKVDAALDANEQRQQELDKAAEAANP